MIVRIPTTTKPGPDEAGHFTTDAILKIAGATASGGPGGWRIGGWTAEGEGRISHGADPVPGPHAYVYGLAGCIAANPRLSTAGEHAAAAAEQRLFEVEAGDLLEIEGTLYLLDLCPRRYPRLTVATAEDVAAHAEAEAEAEREYQRERIERLDEARNRAGSARDRIVRAYAKSGTIEEPIACAVEDLIDAIDRLEAVVGRG